MNATQYPPMCAQLPRTRDTDPINLLKIHVSEDCLYLNVFAPPQVNFYFIFFLIINKLNYFFLFLKHKFKRKIFFYNIIKNIIVKI